MADFYKNSDYYGCDTIASRGFCRIGQSRPAVEGVEYMVLQDLTQEPVTLDDFKMHARVDFNTDDSLLTFYLKSARQYLEQWSQLSFGIKTIRFTAIRVPDKWRLMHGPYTAVNNPDVTISGAKGDILLNGGTEVDIELTSGWPNNLLPDAIKVAICKRAAGDYIVRENLIISDKGTLQSPEQYYDEAQKILLPYRNVTWP